MKNILNFFNSYGNLVIFLIVVITYLNQCSNNRAMYESNQELQDELKKTKSEIVYLKENNERLDYDKIQNINEETMYRYLIHRVDLYRGRTTLSEIRRMLDDKGIDHNIDESRQ